MFAKLSSSKSTVGLGSGAVSHVYIQNPPLRFDISSSRGFYYDDANKLLIFPAPNQILSWKTFPFSPNAAPMADSISEGPILSIRFSLDEKLIAIQRTNCEMQFLLRDTGETFTHRCKSESESILGFFWTDCQSCDIVIVKTSGLDLLAYDSGSKSLNLVDTKKMNVTWYVYTHESRLLLLASGMQCKTFNGFQLSSAGIVRLPKFEMVMAKSDSNSKPILASEDVYIVTVYGRIYCLQVDRVAMQLHSYRFYRDAVIQQGSLPVYSSNVAVTVVDNVLLVHQVDAKVVILYDIFLDSRAPISAPLPLLVRGLSRSNSYTSQYNNQESERSEGSITDDSETIIYGDSWTFLVPDLIFDVANKRLWKIQLDLEAISASCSEVPSILEFLQRRKLEASKAKQLCLAITRTIILERRPVSMVAKALDVLITCYSHSIRTGSYFKGMKPERILSSSQNRSNPFSSTDTSARVDGLRKSINPGTAGSFASESANRFSNSSVSDSEENATFRTLKTGSNDGQTSDKLGGIYTMSSETSLSEAHPSSLQANQSPGPSVGVLNVTTSGQQELQLSSPAVSPDELYRFVFSLVEEEMAGEPSYLVAIILEVLHSANMEKVKLQPNIYVLTIQLLARSERYAELGLFVINKIVEPSKEVALQLVESGRQSVETRKLGLDMLRQLSLHHDYVSLLVQDGYYLEALHYVRKQKVSSVGPSMFLEAAYTSNDPQHLAAVLRFFSDFNHGFQGTSEFYTYCHVLDEMRSSVAS